MKKHRIDRVNSLLREVISDVIQKEVRHPEITQIVSVMRVDTSADLHHAKVYVGLVAPQVEKEKIVHALNQAAKFIAVQSSRQVKLRYFPDLLFKLDTSVDEFFRIETLLSQIEAEKKNRPAE